MKTKKILFYVFAVILGGCIPIMSIDPFYTKSDLTYDEKILGTWVNDSNNEKGSIWIFERAKDSNTVYELTFISGDGKKGLFTANLMKLNGKLFFDVYPRGNPWGTEDPNKIEFPFNTLLAMPMHTILKVDSVQPLLELVMTEDDKIKGLFKEHPDAIAYKEIEDKFVLTASTKELQKFIVKYADDENLFPDKITLKRK